MFGNICGEFFEKIVKGIGKKSQVTFDGFLENVFKEIPGKNT